MAWHKRDTLFYFLLAFSLLVIRIIFLDVRPLHHDESLHGAYALYYLNDPTTGFYKYNPLLHGPFLYHMIPWSYWLFGVSKFSLRFIGVLSASSLFFIPFLFRNRIKKEVVFLSLASIGLSSTLTFYSRFIRHDNFVILSFVLMIFGFFRKSPWQRSLLIASGLAIHLCTKENFYIHFLFLIVYLLFEFIVGTEKDDSNLLKLTTWIRNNRKPFSLGLVTFIFLTIFYYSSGFKYFNGFYDLISGKAFQYWFKQHHTERISGLFSYPLLINLFFESFWLPVIFFPIFSFYREYKKDFWIFAIALVLAFLHCLLFYLNPDNSYIVFVKEYLKIKSAFDCWVFFPLVFLGFFTTLRLVREGRSNRAALYFLFFATFFTYSYLGEKVPWLATYPLVTGLFLNALLLSELNNKRAYLISAGFLALNLFNLYWTNFSSNYHSNLLTQVHTTVDLEEKLFQIQSNLKESPNNKVLVRYESIWPATWFFYGLKGFTYGNHKKPTLEYQFIVTTTGDGETFSLKKEGYENEIVPFRGWWVPNYEKMKARDFFKYMFLKEPWGQKGFQWVKLWYQSTLPVSGNQI